jgi:hypothetical protein
MSKNRTAKRQRLSNRGNPASKRARKPKRRLDKTTLMASDERLETALKYLREGRSQKRAAEIGMVSVKRFRRFLRGNKLAKFKNGRWLITDRRVREVALVSGASEKVVKVRGFGPASLAMRHRAAVTAFLDSNDATLLSPFEGQTVTDIAKRKHLLETRPNELYRYANAGSDAEMKIYRLID